MGNYDVKQEVTDKYSLRGRVFNKLRDDILSGKYEEHEELKEVAIGEEMGVSRTPVRGAFRELELEIRDFCNKKLAEYKWIRAIEFVEQLPKTISGKVRKEALRKG